MSIALEMKIADLEHKLMAALNRGSQYANIIEQARIALDEDDVDEAKRILSAEGE